MATLHVGWVPRGLRGFAVQRPGSFGDHDHEGHPGWRIDQVDANIVSWLRTYTPHTALCLDGAVRTDLTSAVPAVAGWRGSHLPKGITSEKAQALLASCDRPQYAPGRPRTDRSSGMRRQLDTPPAASRRDRAILLLLLRLGPRAIEVARLQLDDVDWRRGEVVIRGKGRRDERLPVPTDVGEAIVAYPRQDRPAVAERSLFMNVRVPYSPMTAQAVKDAVRSAAGRGQSSMDVAGGVGRSQNGLLHTAATTVPAAAA